MNISYEYYRVFYYVARYGSATRAAEALFTNQPNVTHTLHKLEDALGLTLFVRSNRGMTLTREGERLYAHVRVAVEAIQRGEEELGSANRLQSGTITVSASEVALRCFLLPVLREYHNRFPGVKLQVLNHSTPQAVAAVRSGQAELAAVTTPTGDLGQLKRADVMTFRETAVCGASRAGLADAEMSLAELLNEPVVSLGRETMTYRFYEDWFLKNGLIFRADIEAATADQILPMVANDLGVGFVPEAFLNEGLPVVRLKLAKAIPARNVCIIKRGDAPLSVAARELERLCLNGASALQES